MTEPVNASPAPAANATPSNQPQQPVLQAQQQYKGQTQTQDQSAQLAATSAVQAAAAAAVAAVGNQNGLGNSNATEELVCQWEGCGDRFSTAEALYEHVCERHVGRKSTNNLCLTCHWGTCRVTTVKRDHITSHIRVHIPLKPHKCDLCGKSFKRPQDLKKHVKTHADDSVLIRSPEPGARTHQDAPFGGMMNNAKGFTGAHYFEPALNPVHAAQAYHQAPPQYYQSNQHQQPGNPSYGNVFYTLNQGENHSSYDSRKRAYDSVNDFFGDAKRRHFDPTSYAAIGQRLAGLHGLQLPLSGGPASDFPGLQGAVGASSAGGYGMTALATPAYHLPPMSNARTKNDLIDLDRMLDTIQTTVYENDNNVAAAGVGQPGATYIPHRLYGVTQSPPMQIPSSHATATAMAATTAASNGSILAPTTAHSPASATPALTPPSSAQSYTSGRSPSSYSHRPSPPQHDTGASMYPRLPSATMQENMGGYPTTSGAAPPSTLSGNFDYDDHRRRYTGGNLTRARVDGYSPRLPVDGTTDDDETVAVQAKERAAQTTPSVTAISSSLIDPALHRGNSPDPEIAQRTAQAATEATSRAAEEQWLENVRIIEHLKAYIKDRLARGDYEGEDGYEAAEQATERAASTPHSGRMESVEYASGVDQGTPTRAKGEEQHAIHDKMETDKVEESATGLYPILKGIEDAAESKAA